MSTINNLFSKLKVKKIEIIPAVLVKTKEALIKYVEKVKSYVKIVHIDVMDNKFVPNFTVGIKELQKLPRDVKYEFHWMVQNPEKWIHKTKRKCFHIVHIETINRNWDEIKKEIKNARGKLGLAINPETQLKKILPYIKDVEKVLIMSVHPGFSGQAYIKKVEKKISILRKNFPDLDIGVDGGITNKTVRSAIKAGANKIAAASAIFNSKNIKKAIEQLENTR